VKPHEPYSVATRSAGTPLLYPKSVPERARVTELQKGLNET
jgi:hypothetical protein